MISKESVKILLVLACCITTFQVIIIGIQGVFITPGISLDGWDLLKIASIGFASTLPSLLLLGRNKDSWLKRMIMFTVHFILTAGIVFGLLILYEWINATTALYTAAMFLCLYVAAHVVIEIRSRRLAKRINERINAFHESENETHDE